MSQPRPTQPTGAALNPIDLLRTLVGFDTTSFRSNLPLIEWVKAYLERYGIEAQLTRDEGGGKANLFATLGPADRGGVVLSGHTDVVPVAGQPWSTDPFTLTEKVDRLYGRGTADMKGFIAVVLALVPEIRERKLDVPLHLAFSYDEEIGCLGVPALIRALPEDERRPRMVIVGEPTGMVVANAHKGIYAFATTVTGIEGHSSAPERGLNAILAAGEILQFIVRLAEEKRLAAPPGCPFDPPYTTFNVGIIEGGTAQNIIPRTCRFVWECRPLPDDDPAAIRARVDRFVAEDLLPRLRARHPGAAVVTERLPSTPGLAPRPGSPAEGLAVKLTNATMTGTVAFATEAGLFQASGMSAVVCGPGSIDQAHRPDESISLEQLAAGERFVRGLVDWAEKDGFAALESGNRTD